MTKRILIIDDDAGDRELISTFLEQHKGFSIIHASTGEEGVNLAKQENPDIIMLDTKLPGDDGFTVCQNIKNIDGCTSKVIMMTGAIDAVDAVKARKHGADDYCAKSADCEDIIEAVEGIE